MKNNWIDEIISILFTLLTSVGAGAAAVLTFFVVFPLLSSPSATAFAPCPVFKRDASRPASASPCAVAQGRLFHWWPSEISCSGPFFSGIRARFFCALQSSCGFWIPPRASHALTLNLSGRATEPASPSSARRYSSVSDWVSSSTPLFSFFPAIFLSRVH